MADAAALFRLQSWMSPGYPVGAFSYSHGLEAEVEAGTVRDAAGLTAWIETVLTLGTGRIDGPLFRAAHDAVTARDWPALDGAVELGRAFQPSSEIALESLSQGDAFLRACRAAWPHRHLDRLGEGGIVYPIAVAAVCAAHGIALGDALAAYFHGVAANLVSAGVRAIPLGQTDGQKTLAALEPAVIAAAERAMTTAIADMGTAAPLLDIASMHHETQYSRLFRS